MRRPKRCSDKNERGHGPMKFSRSSGEQATISSGGYSRRSDASSLRRPAGVFQPRREPTRRSARRPEGPPQCAQHGQSLVG